MVFFIPDLLGHPDNYIPANMLVTPEHIKPEWYFLPFYAILRSIPNKLFGVLAMALSIGILAVLPLTYHKYLKGVALLTRSATFRPYFRKLF